MQRRPPFPALSLVLLGFLVVGCGARPPGGGSSEEVGAYPALRWAPAEVTYGAVIKRADGAIAATRDLLEGVAIAGDFELREIDDAIRNYLGVNPLSVDDMRAAGVDVAAGAVVFSQGFSPTFVFQLADPAAMQARIDAQRERAGPGAGIGNAVVDGVEVFTALGDRELHTHWAIDRGWMWVHFEIVDEHEAEGGWFEASRAARGALAGDRDFAWARTHAERLQPGAAVFGLVRPQRLAARVAAAAHHPQATACMSLVTWPRAAVTMGTTATAAEGHVLVDTAADGAAIARMALPVPSGWAARGAVAVSAEWNVDLVQLGQRVLPCGTELARAAAESGVRGIRGYLATFDADELDGTGAVAAEIAHRAMIDAMLDEIPARRFMESRRKYGPLDGVRLDPRVFPAVDYVITKDRAMAGLGDGALVRLIADGATVPGALAAIDVRPRALTSAAWDVILDKVGGVRRDTARQRTIARLTRWQRGTLELRLAGELLHLTARGERP